MADPLYRQVAEDLRHKIDEGELKPKDKLPTEDELMEEYRASRNTVRGAIKELTTRGTVYTLHGRGTFVTEPVNPTVTTLTTDPKTGSGGGEGFVYTAEVARSGRKARMGPTQVLVQQAGQAIFAVADSLKIPEQDEVILRHEERFVDERPWSLQTSYYPKSLLSRAPRLLDATSIEEGTVAYLATCGITQVGYWDAIEVRSPNQGEVDFFGLPSDGRIQVIEIYRVAFDQEKNRYRLTVTVYRADRNRFLIKVGHVPDSEDSLPAN